MRGVCCLLSQVKHPKLVSPDLVRRWFREGKGHPLLAEPSLRAEAVRVLEYCLEDIIDSDAQSVLQLIGVPLLPLASPTLPFASISLAGDNP